MLVTQYVFGSIACRCKKERCVCDNF